MSDNRQEYIRKYQREWKAKRRAKYLALLGGVCVKCGSDEQLEVDHIDPTSKKDHKIWSWKEERIEAELKKCQLLCRNCHIKKTMEQNGLKPSPHGSWRRYQKHKCRCEKCKAKSREYKRRWREKNGRN